MPESSSASSADSVRRTANSRTDPPEVPPKTGHSVTNPAPAKNPPTTTLNDPPDVPPKTGQGVKNPPETAGTSPPEALPAAEPPESGSPLPTNTLNNPPDVPPKTGQKVTNPPVGSSAPDVRVEVAIFLKP